MSVSSKSLASTLKVCQSCGLDAEATLQHVSNVTKKQRLLEEKLEVETELLKQDKRNFRRRMKAAKQAHTNRQREAEAIQAESKEALDLALRRQREYEQQIREAAEKKDIADSDHKAEVEQLKERIRMLEKVQKASEKDKEDLQGDLKVKLEESEKRIQSLESQLESKQSSIESYEMQLLEMERERDTGSVTSATCVSCTRLEVQLKEHQTTLQDCQDEVSRTKTKLAQMTDEKKSLAAELSAIVESSADSDNAVGELSKNLESLQLGKQQADDKNTELEQELANMKKENTDLYDKLANAATPAPVSSDDSSPQWEPTSDHTFEMEYEWHGPVHVGIYTGWLNADKVPDGPGTLRLEDGAVYDGHWKNGQRHGTGIYATLEGDIYRGGWCEDQHHGADCVFVWSDGRVYQGAYQHGRKHGAAVMTWPHGATFRGQYVDDQRNGSGTYLYSDGRCYTGQYRDERPHGMGVLTAADGETVIYEGPWEFGEFVGQ